MEITMRVRYARDEVCEVMKREYVAKFGQPLVARDEVGEVMKREYVAKFGQPPAGYHLVASFGHYYSGDVEVSIEKDAEPIPIEEAKPQAEAVLGSIEGTPLA